MMVAHATVDGGKKLIILGLERGNIDRLEQGRPMSISAESHPGFPIENVQIVIMFGETPRDLVDQVKPFINEQTKVVAVPRDHDKGKSS